MFALSLLGCQISTESLTVHSGQTCRLHQGPPQIDRAMLDHWRLIGFEFARLVSRWIKSSKGLKLVRGAEAVNVADLCQDNAANVGPMPGMDKIGD